jgi:hypothetical protein
VSSAVWHYELEVYSEYGQFQVGDRQSRLEFAWDRGAFDRHMAAAKDVVSIATTTMFGNVSVTVEEWASEPPLDTWSFDQVVEASIELSTGLLSVTSVSSDIKIEREVPARCHRLRAGFQDLGKGAGAVATDRGGDSYLVQLWPSDSQPPTVLKIWRSWPDSSVEGAP